jgi:hypothetical protein
MMACSEPWFVYDVEAEKVLKRKAALVGKATTDETLKGFRLRTARPQPPPPPYIDPA